MKPLLHRYITVFMACLVLLSSTGFALVEHQCMMRGKSLRFLQEKSISQKTEKKSTCCSKRKLAPVSEGTYFKKKDCCKENHKFQKLETVSSSLPSSFKVTSWNTGLLPDFSNAFHFLPVGIAVLTDLHFSIPISFSSVFHGRSMRSFIQSFLI